jgi:hypothetical protein
MGTFEFVTNSRVEPTSDPDYPFVVKNCIANRPPFSVMHVWWLIPNVNGWLKTDEIPSERRIAKGHNVTLMDGCLEYGIRGDMTKAPFLGDKAAKDGVAAETSKGCLQAAADAYDEAQYGPVKSFTQTIKNYFPSGLKDAARTMLRLDAEVGIRANVPSSGPATSYVSFMNYKIQRLEGSEGNPRDITMRPAFKGATEALSDSFGRKNPEPIKAGEDGSIAFEVTEIVNPKLAYATYNIYDRERNLVASVDFPVFVSGSR